MCFNKYSCVSFKGAVSYKIYFSELYIMLCYSLIKIKPGVLTLNFHSCLRKAAVSKLMSFNLTEQPFLTALPLSFFRLTSSNLQKPGGTFRDVGSLHKQVIKSVDNASLVRKMKKICLLEFCSEKLNLRCFIISFLQM